MRCYHTPGVFVPTMHRCPLPSSVLQIESKTVHKRELLAADEERRLQQLESKLTGAPLCLPAAALPGGSALALQSMQCLATVCGIMH